MKNLEKKGFSLAELLLCLVIIGVVSAMGMTIAKHSSDRAYNLFYYAGYINLYNAIADAKATGNDIGSHIQTVFDDNNVACDLNSIFNFNSIYAVVKNPNLGPGNTTLEDHFERDPDNKYVDTGIKDVDVPSDVDNGTISDVNPGGSGGSSGGSGGSLIDKTDSDETQSIFDDNQSILDDDQTKDDDTTTNQNGDTVTGDYSDVTWPEIIVDDDGNATGGAGVTTVVTNNGIRYHYLDNNNNFIAFVMTVPQRKTRTNNGFATVRLLYVNEANGYLIPIVNGSDVDLQTRRDLLPAYIDDGKIGRNNALDRNKGFNYQPIRYANYKEAFCTLNKQKSVTGVISCSGMTDITPNSGVLKVANPQKAR